MNKALPMGTTKRDVSVRDIATYPAFPGPRGEQPHHSVAQVRPYSCPLIVWWEETARIYSANMLLYHFSKWEYWNQRGRYWNFCRVHWIPSLERVLPKITTTQRPRDMWTEIVSPDS